MDDVNASLSPVNVLHRYEGRIRGVDKNNCEEVGIVNIRYKIGDKVWLRPPVSRCDKRYQEATVDGIISDQAVLVNGVPRHVRDIRRRNSEVNHANVENINCG